MKKILCRLFLMALIGCIPFSGVTQNNTLTLADAARLNPKTQPQRLRNIQWMGDSDAFVFAENNALIKGTPHTGKQDTIVRLDDLNDALLRISEETLRGLPLVKFIDESRFTFVAKNKLFRFDLKDNRIEQINSYPEEGENPDIHEATFGIAYTIANNLFVVENNQTKQVTADQDPAIVNGKAAHRFEFGIDKGIFWSPDGEKLAFYRVDERNISEYPIVDVSKRVAETTPIRYPMAGMASEEVTVGVYNVNTGTTLFLEQQKGGEKDHYWTHITWSPDGRYILAALVNRDQNRMDLCRFDAETGNYLNTIYTETNARYVEPVHDPYFLPASNTDFLWVSSKDGFPHLYFLNVANGLVRQITTGAWSVTDVTGCDRKGENVFFVATKDHPLEKNIYCCNIKSGKITRLSPDPGTHHSLLNKKGTLVLDIFSSIDVPYAVKIEDTKGKVLRTVFSSPDPLQDYRLGAMTIDKIRSDNGADLYYRLIKPVGFNPDKKYPVIIYVYGGPHSQLVTNSWLGGNDMFLFYLAQEGYVVFTIDNQGSANRGFEFESIIHRRLGEQEIKDQMAGLNFLKQFPWIDETRIGVDGWSYGGFMTINMLLTHPGVFKAGCAGGPVCDWKYYEVMYGERYMDTPEQNPEGYKNSSLIERAADLKDHLLIIHGDQDPIVVWQHSLEFVRRCIDNGIQLDYFVYPGHEHNVRGKDRVHLYQKITDYFNEKLK